MKLMKKLVVLIAIMMMSSKSFSQTATDITLIRLEKPIVRLVIKDLIVGDGTKQELSFTQDKVKLLEQKIILKDDIIYNLNTQIFNYKSIIDTRSEQLALSQELSNRLQNDLKKSQIKNKMVAGTGILGILAVLFILK
jgi:uncharacterized coiled-coil protein SlyX